VMGIWSKRTTTLAAVLGIIGGFGLCIFYLVTTRYFPQAGVNYFGMSALSNAVTGSPIVDVAKTLADPKWIADVPASAANPLQSKVGWFGLNNINCGLLGMPLGFLIMYVVSRLGPEPSPEMQAMVEEIRKPRGRTVLEEH
jgi:cation/acetate symporter